MTVLILLTVVCGETFWLYRLGAFGALTGLAAAAAAGATAFYDKAASIIGGFLS